MRKTTITVYLVVMMLGVWLAVSVKVWVLVPALLVVVMLNG